MATVFLPSNYSFTAPSVRPRIRYRCEVQASKITGITSITPKADIVPHSRPLSVIKPATTTGTVSLTSAQNFVVEAGSNGDAEVAALGFEQGSFGGANSGQFLTEVDISTVEGAERALSAVDNALDSVNRERADLGAIQNRLDSTIGALAINMENLAAARSRILDADFAAETAELSRTQVLQQAGVSILAQANAQPQLVLSLLQ